MHTCPPICSAVANNRGIIVVAASYLDAHYLISPQGCNTQVVVPWVWNARFAAELTFQSCTKAADPTFDKHGNHSFNSLYARWSQGLQKDMTDSQQNKLSNLAGNCKQFFQPIDEHDPDGLMFRYPVNINQGFLEHCGWPLLCRKLIATICDVTKVRIEMNEDTDDRGDCIHLLDFLRATACAGYCYGSYNRDRSINPDLLRKSPASFTNTEVEAVWLSWVEDQQTKSAVYMDVMESGLTFDQWLMSKCEVDYGQVF